MKKQYLLEKIAELEHLQWTEWTSYMLNNLTDENIKRWKRQMKVSYLKLPEEQKCSDRIWAKKVLELISENKL